MRSVSFTVLRLSNGVGVLFNSGKTLRVRSRPPKSELDHGIYFQKFKKELGRSVPYTVDAVKIRSGRRQCDWPLFHLLVVCYSYFATPTTYLQHYLSHFMPVATTSSIIRANRSRYYNAYDWHVAHVPPMGNNFSTAES